MSHDILRYYAPYLDSLILKTFFILEHLFKLPQKCNDCWLSLKVLWFLETKSVPWPFGKLCFRQYKIYAKRRADYTIALVEIVKLSFYHEYAPNSLTPMVSSSLLYNASIFLTVGKVWEFCKNPQIQKCDQVDA